MLDRRYGQPTARKARSKIRETRISPRVRWNEALDKSVVAAIPYAAITAMTREELIRVIEAADLSVLGPRVSDHLPYLERKILERLAHLARRCCRNQGFLETQDSAAEWAGRGGVAPSCLKTMGVLKPVHKANPLTARVASIVRDVTAWKAVPEAPRHREAW